MLQIHFSNRYEVLADLLQRNLDDQRGDLFVADRIIVPSAAVRRSLTLALADQRGICANVEFSFLARWLWQQIRLLVPEVAPESPFSPEVLTWQIYTAFTDHDWVAEQPRLSVYLRDADEVMHYDLACRVAGVFDQYITFRPEWLQAWTEGRSAGPPSPSAESEADQRWQAALWRRIIDKLGVASQHPANRFIDVLRLADAPRLAEAGVPASAHVFALPAMPPLHMHILRELGRCIDLHLYVLNPCREYWFELIDRGRLGYLAARGRDAGHEEGNRLLAAWGRQTQSHIDLLIDQCGDAASDDGEFAPLGGDTLLARLHDSVLNMVDLEPGSVQLGADDRSVEVHVCHSLTRELEVLQDQLLGLFAADEELQPADILVVTPALDTAGPLIEAVFDTAPKARFIPYSITGRARSTVNAPARALLELMALLTSRCTAGSLFGLLQQPIVARRFGLDENGLQRVHDWIRASGARWALDARHRSGFDLPADPRHTMADALDRLFLGYALPEDTAIPLAVGAAANGDIAASEILPCGDAEGTEANALGAFAAFVEAFRRLHAATSVAQPPDSWATRVLEAIDTFLLADGDEIDDLVELQVAVRHLADELQRGGVVQPLPLAIVRTALAQRLDDPEHGGVPGGGVTFSSINNLRNVPFKIVCAIGLDDGRFPTTAPPPEFDLIAQQPRRGDRQRRSDERNLFLDLLLSARHCLYLSYTGRSVRDNAPLPPSVLVAELLDVLVPAIAADPNSSDARAAARNHLVVEHPLQPFSPVCFNIDSDPRLRSYNNELGTALRASAAAPQLLEPVETAVADTGDDDEPGEILPPFFRAALPAPGAEWHDVSLAQLVEFFRNPCRFLLRRRLNIDLWRDDDEIEEDEPFLPDWSGSNALAERLLPALLAGADPDVARRLALAGTEMPSGALGALKLEAEVAALSRFAEAVRAATAEPILPPHQVDLEFDLDGEQWRLHAAFADLRSRGLVRWQYTSTHAGAVLAAWLNHLALCADLPAGVQPATEWVLKDTPLTFPPFDHSRDVFAELLRIFRSGLCRPLHFFPKSAWEYSTNDGKMYKARNKWVGRDGAANGESNDAAYRLALRGVTNPLDEEFTNLARTIFDPVLAALPEKD